MLSAIIRENIQNTIHTKSYMNSVAEKVLELIEKLEKDSNGEFEKCCTPKQFLKGEYLLRVGEVTNSIWYIETGIAHEYLEQDDIILTQSLVFPNVFIDYFPSTVIGLPSPKNIRLLTDASVIEIDYEKTLKIDSIRELVNYTKTYIIIHYVLEMRERLFQFQFLNASERYQVMVEQQPHLVKEIPSIYLADYLGILPETLSRIRKNVDLSKTFDNRSTTDYVFNKINQKRKKI